LSNSLENIAKRSALLLALLESKNGIKKSDLDKIIPEWKEHLIFFSDLKLNIRDDRDVITLVTPVSYDLYQSVPPEIRDLVEEILSKLIDKEEIIDPTTLESPLYKPKIIKPSSDSNKCINCADPACMSYGKDNFGGVDKFPSLVCPAEIIQLNKNGFLQINDSECTGCTLCVIRCPINAINLVDVASHNKYKPEEVNKIVDLFVLPITERKRETEKLLNQFSKSKKEPLFNDLKFILDNFDTKVSRAGFNWNRDKYYIFIRNLFRELGLEAAYTGSGGMLRRADVTITAPFVVGMEVKSPAESDIDTGAVRQAFDAKLEVSSTYKESETYCAVIGQEISRGAHKNSLRYLTSNAKIPLLRGRYLLYLLIKHITNLPQDPLNDIKRLFTDFSGWFGRDEITSYFNTYFDLRIETLKQNKKSEEKIRELETLRKKTIKEIKHCFPDPKRKARAGYGK